MARPLQTASKPQDIRTPLSPKYPSKRECATPIASTQHVRKWALPDLFTLRANAKMAITIERRSCDRVPPMLYQVSHEGMKARSFRATFLCVFLASCEVPYSACHQRHPVIVTLNLFQGPGIHPRAGVKGIACIAGWPRDQVRGPASSANATRKGPQRDASAVGIHPF